MQLDPSVPSMLISFAPLSSAAAATTIAAAVSSAALQCHGGHPPSHRRQVMIHVLRREQPCVHEFHERLSRRF